MSRALGKTGSIPALPAINRPGAIHRYCCALRYLSSTFHLPKCPGKVDNIFFIQAFSVYANVWLAKWSEANATDPATRDLYLGVYGALGVGQGKNIKLDFYRELNLNCKQLLSMR